MTGYVFAAALIALLALEVEVEAELSVGRSVSARARVGLSGARLIELKIGRVDGALALIVRLPGSRRAHVRALGGSGGTPGWLKPALRAGGARLRRDVRIRRIGLSARLGAGDAALSALLCGLVNMLAAGLCAAANVRPELDVRPEFEREEFTVSASGMLSARVGHIIGAGLAGMAEYLKGAFDRWKTQLALTRSRA